MSNCIFTVWVSFARKIYGVSRGVKHLGSGFPIGERASLLAHDFAWQSVVCYTLCLRCCENAVTRGHVTGFERAGKQAGFVVGENDKSRAGFVSRQGVYGNFRFSQHDRVLE